MPETTHASRSYFTGDAERYRRAAARVDAEQGNIWTERDWWRRGVLALVGLTAVLGLVILALAKRPSHEPVFVKVNGEGQLQILKWDAYEPGVAEVQQDLIRWMRCMRGLPTDPAILEYCWKLVPMFLLDRTQALVQVQAFYKSLNPQSLLFKKKIDLEDMRAWRKPDGRWQLDWTETVYAFTSRQGLGRKEQSTRMSAEVTITRRQPTSRKEMEYHGEPVNPRGIYINSISWGQ